jgi:DNA-binding response OmpR family regulator
MAAHIVVIDDDEVTRELLSVTLRAKNWQVFSYTDAEINLAIIKQLHPDLIMLAFHIRDGTGWEFLQTLKMENATANIPIFLTTPADHLSAKLQGYLLAKDIRVVNRPFDFDTFLPLVQNALTLASQTGVAPSSGQSLPILVVEDMEELRETLTTILQLDGHQVETAENGQLALEAVNDAQYCVILLDIRMPIMDGFEFLKAYEQQLVPHIPVVVLSGEVDILTEIFPSFVIDVLPKPYAINRLLSIVKRYTQPALT